MANIIIIHGTLGSPQGNWFPWMEAELRQLGHHVFVPSFPTPDNQHPDPWFQALQDQAPAFDDQTILVGHSIGATFVLCLLMSVKSPVKKSFFIAPVMGEIGNEEYDALNQGFISQNWDWDHIRQVTGEAVIMHGSDDPYVPADQPRLLSTHLDVPVEWFEKGGHLNAESGFTTFPELLAKITAST